MKKLLFIDRDGTLIQEPEPDKQVDSLEKLEFMPGVFKALSEICEQTDFSLVMVTNQDGLGTDSFPEDTFWPAHNKMIKAFENEGVVFEDVYIDKSFAHEGLPSRKPGTAMLSKYIFGTYNLSESYVIGDRHSDVKLAENLSSQAIYYSAETDPRAVLSTVSWKEIAAFLISRPRIANIRRKTKETDITLSVNLDDPTRCQISTGLRFFDHMLEQISRHGGISIEADVQGDLDIDEHHTIEDFGLAFGQAFKDALGSKKAIERYAFVLPMDDSLAQVAVDFGGRPFINWDVKFERERIGDVATEMFEHFFKSFSDAAQCNIDISCRGKNEHHKIESIFKGFAKCLSQASRKTTDFRIPSTKESL